MRKRPSILRQKSLIAPEIVNPFVYKLRLKWWQKIQVAIMSVTIAPIRLICLVFCFFLAWMFAVPAVYCRSEEDKKKPFNSWRKTLKNPARWIARLAFFLTGFHWIKFKGKCQSAVEAPIVCCAPHTSFIDVICAFLVNDPLAAGVSRIESARMPIGGTLARLTEPVFVQREDPNSRQNTIKEIVERATSGGKWPQMMIFPEGTCGNRTCLISFKQGAFIPGVPVQPLCIRYTNSLDTYTWTWEGPSAWTLLWLTLCQFHNGLTIEYLPVYKPSEEEKADPKLYADNVRKVMAKALNVPTTDHTYDDCRLMLHAQELNLPIAAGLVETQKLQRKLGMNFDQMKELLDKFSSMTTITNSKDGRITLQQFADYLGLPVSQALKHLFQMYDRDDSGTIDFREYLIGLSLVSRPANSEETVLLAFKLFDSEEKGYIEKDNLFIILCDAFGMEEEGVDELFKQVDKNGDNKITYDEFKLYAQEKPEYAKLFQTYQGLKSDKESNSTDTNSDTKKAQ